MREFLLEYCPVIMLILMPLNVLTLSYFARSYIKNRHFITLCFLVVSCGLFYDSFILALGGVHQGPMLETLLVLLSQFRYIFHGAMIPFLFSVCAYGVTKNERARKIVFGVTIVCSIIGIASGFCTGLDKTNVANIVRYATADSTTAWASGWTNLLSYGTVIPLIICGIVIWVRKHTPTLFLAGLFMYAFAAIGPSTGNSDLIFLITMFGEECMVFWFIRYNHWLVKHNED